MEPNSVGSIRSGRFTRALLVDLPLEMGQNPPLEFVKKISKNNLGNPSAVLEKKSVEGSGARPRSALHKHRLLVEYFF